jgi:hypothetical protein
VINDKGPEPCGIRASGKAEWTVGACLRRLPFPDIAVVMPGQARAGSPARVDSGRAGADCPGPKCRRLSAAPAPSPRRRPTGPQLHQVTLVRQELVASAAESSWQRVAGKMLVESNRTLPAVGARWAQCLRCRSWSMRTSTPCL